MAYSKIILNGDTLMDVTGDTVDAGKLLYGETATKNSGAKVTGNIASKSSSDLTASGATVTAPAGYYSSNATKSVASGSATPASSISATGATVSTGTNTLTLSKTVSNTPSVSAGYISNGTSGNSSVSLTASVNTRSSSDLTVSGATVTAPSGYYSSSASKSVASGSTTPASSISGSSATVTTGTNTLTLSKTVSNTPQVTAGYISSGTSGNSAVSLTASVNTRSSSDLTASTLTVTAPSGYYASNATKTLTDANLTAGNIKKDVLIFGVTGTYEGGGGGATNIVQGTFTAGTEGTVQTINVPYTGNGYPIELNISVNGGIYVNNSGYTNAQTWYDAIHQNAIGKYSMSKCGATNAPVYSSSNTFIDGGTVTSVYKNSSSSNTSFTRGYTLYNLLYTSADPTATSTNTVTIPSNTSFKVLVSGETSGYGFLSGLVYSYYVVYSE